MIVSLFKVIMNLGGQGTRRRYYPRIDTAELKLRIEKRLGRQYARKYFNLLNRYFSFKLSKSDFDRLCIELLGRENLSLHNGLIQAIMTNASATEAPPRNGEEGRAALNVKGPNVYKQGSFQSLCRDVFPQSPRKGRTPILRDRKLKDQPSPLGPHGKLGNVVCDDSMAKVSEQLSATELLSLGSRPPLQVTSVEDGEEVEQASGSPSINSLSPLRAPFGVSILTKGTRKVFSHGSPPFGDADTCLNNGELPNLSSLKKRLEQKLETENLSVTHDCANLMNNGLDVFIKRLLKPSLDVAASRSESKLPNMGHHQVKYFSTNVTQPVKHLQRPDRSFSVSMTDFRVAMESNPRLLGGDWPRQLEKVSSCASEDNMDE